MTAPVPPSFDEVLRLCAAAAPEPWYPARYTGDRDSLDESLTQLRLAGLVRLTTWEQGTGQGYELTATGRATLDDPRAAARLREGRLPVPRPAAAVARRRERREATEAGSLLTVTNITVAAIVVTFGIGMQLALKAGVSLPIYLESGLSPILESFALSPKGVADGQWWRLLTYALVHVGGLHFLLNVFCILADGPIVEDMYGRGRFVVLLLLSTFGGALVALITSRPVAGSSGTWCGLIGGQIAYMMFHREVFTHETVQQWRTRTARIIILTVLISLLPNVSWEAHLGGAMAGFIAGLLLVLERDGRGAVHWLGLFGLVFLTAIGLGFVVGRGEALKSLASQRDRTNYTTRVGPATEAVQRRATAYFDDVADPLRDVRPEIRDPEKVQAAIDGLKNLKAEIKTAFSAAQFPFITPEIEQARQAALDSLAKLAELLDEYQECFLAGDKWRQEQEGNLLRLRALALESDIRQRRAARQVSAP